MLVNSTGHCQMHVMMSLSLGLSVGSSHIHRFKRGAPRAGKALALLKASALHRAGLILRPVAYILRLQPPHQFVLWSCSSCESPSSTCLMWHDSA